MNDVSENHPSSTPPLSQFTKMLRSDGAAGKEEAFWFTRYVVRRVSPYLSWLFVRLGVSGNLVTLLSGISFATGAVLLGLNNRLAMLVGAALILLYHLLDHCDGEVARYNRLTGRRVGGRDGMFYDTLVHGMEPLLILCLAFRLYQQGDLGTWPLILAAVDVTATCVAPGLRYYLVFVRWLEARYKADPSFRLEASEVPYEDALFAGDPAVSRTLLSRALLVVKQMLLFPGYFVTLAVAVVLDVTLGPAFHIGSAAVHWQAIWLALHALGAALAVIHWTIVNAGRLRELKD